MDVRSRLVVLGKLKVREGELVLGIVFISEFLIVIGSVILC